jgi:RNA polymerase sigma-70 factor (ECF subfamily)
VAHAETARTDAEFADVALAAAGDATAFERLYRRHLARVGSLARWLVGPDDVDDAVQDVFIRVWEKLGTFSGQSAFGTWLHRVAVNLLLRRRQTLGRDRYRLTDEEGWSTLAAPRSDPNLRVALESAVDRLPAGARDVFVLHDVEGYKHDDIAGLLGIDAGTSRSQLHRARMLLRRQLTA